MPSLRLFAFRKSTENEISDFWSFIQNATIFTLISEGSDSVFLECDLDVTKLPLYVFIYSFLAGIHFLGLCSYGLI